MTTVTGGVTRKMSSKLITSQGTTTHNNGILTHCIVPNCNRWSFVCKDNRPAKELCGESYCKYHFLVDTFLQLNQALNGITIFIGSPEQVRTQMANRQKMEFEINVIVREIRDLIKVEDVPPAELASFKQVFGGLFR